MLKSLVDSLKTSELGHWNPINLSIGISIELGTDKASD